MSPLPGVTPFGLRRNPSSPLRVLSPGRLRAAPLSHLGHGQCSASLPPYKSCV